MNILLKNYYTNHALGFLCCSISFVIGVTPAYLLGVVILAAIALYVAGGISYWVVKWFEKKYVLLNGGELE